MFSGNVESSGCCKDRSLRFECIVDVRVIAAPYTNTVCHVVSILTSSRCYAAY